MASIGARAISAHAAITSRSTPAIAFLAIYNELGKGTALIL